MCDARGAENEGVCTHVPDHTGVVARPSGAGQSVGYKMGYQSSGLKGIFVVLDSYGRTIGANDFAVTRLSFSGPLMESGLRAEGIGKKWGRWRGPQKSRSDLGLVCSADDVKRHKAWSG